jgi:methyl-accepting chemotaxis protein
MSPRRRKILGYTAMFLSLDVLVASILSMILMWVAFSAAGNLLVNLFEAGEKATAVADKALAQLDTGMVEFGNKSSDLSANIAAVGQNVEDKGVIATLLPPDQETVFTDKVNEVKQTVGQVQDAIDSVRNFMQAFQALPFIQTPNLDDTLLGKLNDGITKIEELAAQIKQGIEDARSGIAGAVNQIAAALGQVSDAVFEARFPLAQLRGYVQAANQVILPFLQAFTPIFFLFVGLIFTLLYGWTAFVMWKFFQWARAWRKGASPTLTPAPAASEPAAAPVEPAASEPVEKP